MILPESYPAFALVTLASTGVVAAGSMILDRLALRPQLALTVSWIAAHAIAFASGVGGTWVSNALVLGSAAGVAAVLARTVHTAGSLVALAFTASLVDVLSFSSGPTRWLLSADSPTDVLRYLAVSFPLTGDQIAVVGIGDLVVLGTLFLGLTQQGHRRSVALTVVAAGLLIALWVGLARGGAFGIPFMAAGAIALIVLGWRRPR